MKNWGSLDCCKNEFNKYKFIFILSLADDDTLFAVTGGVLHPRRGWLLSTVIYGKEVRTAHLLDTMRSTSTDESILNVVMSLTTDDGHMMSITLLWILISYLSQVLVPSPHGDFLVVILRIFVGILTGPLVSYPLFLALVIISLQASSKCFTALPLSCTLFK